jgi:Spy/CpxP family protein refolding chaperone
MRLKIQVLALSGMLALAVSSGLAQATPSGSMEQQGPPPPMGEGMRHHGPMTPEMQLEHLTRALDLSADQQAQVKPILETRRQQMMQLHQDQSTSREDKMAKMKTLDEDAHSKIAALLNDQQKAKFQKMMDRQEQEHAMHHGPGGEQGPPPQPQQ